MARKLLRRRLPMANGNGRSSFRAILLVLGALIPIVAVIVVAFLVSYDARWKALADRRYRALAHVSNELSDALDGAREAFKNKGDRCFSRDERTHDVRLDASCAPAIQLQAGAHLPDIPSLTYVGESRPLDHGPLERTGHLCSQLVDEGRGRLSLYVLYDASASPCAESSILCENGGARLCASLDVGAVLTDILQAEGIDGEMLLADARGNVLLQNERATGRIRNAVELLGDCAGIGAGASLFGLLPTAEKPAGERALTPGRIQSACHRNVPHELLAIPVALPRVAAGGDAPRDDAGATSAAPQLLLVSLTPEAQWTAEARAVPPLWAAMVMLAVVVVLLAWPALKLWTMGPHERVTGIDVRLLALSAVLLSALATLGLRDLDFHVTLAGALDGQMSELADEVETKFLDEMSSAAGLVRELATVGAVPESPAFVRFTDAVLVKPDGIPYRRWTSQIADDTGARRVSEDPSPPVFPIADRRYFRDALAGDVWGLGLPAPGAENRGIAVEAVRSRVTAQFTMVLAAASGEQGEVALVAIPMADLEQPVVAPGFRFAIVDRSGDVQIHSNSARNLRENLITECDGDAELASLVESRRADWLSGSCYGLQQRIYARPIADTPWSIVILRDKRYAQSASAEISVLWLTIFGVYFAWILVVLLTVQVVNERYRANWLWPRRSLAGSYAAAAPWLFASAAFLVLASRHVSAVGVAALLLAVPATSVALLCRMLADPSPEAGVDRRIAAVVAAVGAATVIATLAAERLWLEAGIWSLLVALAWTLSTRRELRTSRIGLVEGRFRLLYAATLLAALGVIAIAPALVLFRDARDSVAAAFVKDGQLAFATARVERAVRIRHRAVAASSSRQKALGMIAERAGSDPSQVEPGVFASAWLSWPAPRPPASQETGERTLLGGRDCVAATAEDLCEERCCDAGTTPDLLSHLFLGAAPAYHLTSLGIRRSACDGASDAAWCWSPAASGGYDLRISDRGIAARLLKPESPIVPQREAHDPFGRPAHLAVLAVVTAVAAFLGLGLLWALARLVFHLDADLEDPDRLHDGPGRRGVRRIYSFETPLRPGALSRPAVGGAPIDLRDPGALMLMRWIAAGSAASAGTCVALDHAEAVVGDADRERDVVDALLALRSSGMPVRLLSEVDPLAGFADEAAAPAKLAKREEPHADGAEKTGASGGTSGEADGRATSLRVWSAALADMSRRLVAVEGDVAQRYAEPGRWDLDAGERLYGRNRRIWDACSASEKLALRQLACEGFLSPADGEVARSLAERGLLRRAPAFELLDDSFRWFVLRTVPRAALEQWESAGGPSGWSRLRVPLAALLALGATVIVITQRETFYTAIGIVGAVGAVLPRLIDFFGRLGNQRPTPA